MNIDDYELFRELSIGHMIVRYNNLYDEISTAQDLPVNYSEKMYEMFDLKNKIDKFDKLHQGK
jgi:hypothetical protein